LYFDEKLGAYVSDEYNEYGEYMYSFTLNEIQQNTKVYVTEAAFKTEDGNEEWKTVTLVEKAGKFYELTDTAFESPVDFIDVQEEEFYLGGNYIMDYAWTFETNQEIQTTDDEGNEITVYGNVTKLTVSYNGEVLYTCTVELSEDCSYSYSSTEGGYFNTFDGYKLANLENLFNQIDLMHLDNNRIGFSIGYDSISFTLPSTPVYSTIA
jgi:hypothetical protein